MISLFHRSPSIVHRRARPLQRNIILERVYFGNDAIVKCHETDVKLSRAARYEIPRSYGSDAVLSVVAKLATIEQIATAIAIAMVRSCPCARVNYCIDCLFLLPLFS